MPIIKTTRKAGQAQASRLARLRAGRQWRTAMVATGLAVAAADAAAKQWATNVGQGWAGSIEPATNDSYALGTVSGPSHVLAAISLAVLAVVSWYTSNRADWFHSWAVGLLVGGGVANAVERIANSAVTDFLAIGPLVINLADIAIFIGVVTLTTDALRAHRNKRVLLQRNSAPRH